MDKKKQPNVIIILADDAGYGDLGCYGNPHINTPTLDSMYQDSVRLEDFHTDPMCAPTRASLLSGKNSANVGVWSTLNGRYIMQKEHKIIANYFKNSGYNTGMFGKWHMGDNYPYRPYDRGFNHSSSFGGGVIGEVPDFWNNDYFDDKYAINGELMDFDGYCTDVWFNQAKKFVENNREDDPFFLYIATNAPHSPFNVDNKYSDPYKNMGVPDSRARFYGMVQNVDENMGVFQKYLAEKNILDNTIIIYFGDNGTSEGAITNSEGFVTDGYNAGLRGKKCSPYEGGHKNACFIRWEDGNIKGGRDLGGISFHMDLLPTLIDLCELSDNQGNFDGKSLARPLLDGREKLDDRTMVIHNMQLETPEKYKDFCVLTNEYRLVNTQLWDQKHPELFLISQDPSQKKDISKANKDVCDKLLAHYEGWWDTISKQFSKFSRISIGSEFEKETKLTCHAWRDCKEFCYNQWHVRDGINGAGFWSLNIEVDGEYAIDISRWPKEADASISASVQAIEATSRTHKRNKGFVYNVVKAQIEIQGTTQIIDVTKDDKMATFKVNLKKGAEDLKALFILESGEAIGAYYGYVRLNG